MRFERHSKVAIEVFRMEMEKGSQIYHKYVVPLLGYYLEHNPILVYEYPDNGSFWDHLHGELQTFDLGT